MEGDIIKFLNSVFYETLPVQILLSLKSMMHHLKMHNDPRPQTIHTKGKQVSLSFRLYVLHKTRKSLYLFSVFLLCGFIQALYWPEF